MPEVRLPFSKERLEIGREHLYGCNLHPLLPKPLQEICAEKGFLMEYLHYIPIGEVGVPAYYPQLSRELEKQGVRNLIYPIKDGLFVHIYPDAQDRRDFYIPIEPSTTLELDHLMERVESKLLDVAEEIGRAETEEEKRQVLLKSIERICVVGQNGSNRIQVTPRELEGIKYRALRDKMGLGILQPLLLDPYIEDISCSGIGPIFVEHKIFRSLKSTIFFSSYEELDAFVLWLAERIKKPVTVRHPIVDALLPDGSRVNIVYGTDVSKRGSNFTIRRFSETPYSIFDLIEYGTLDYLMAAYLWLVIEENLNTFIVGGTASGKTTTLNALMAFIPADAKIVSIEDTPELQTPHDNWIRGVAKASTQKENSSEVTMFDLLKAALRQRPNTIIIGEIRGEEGNIAFQAMQTGHGVISTFHAASMTQLIQRLTGDPIKVPRPFLDNLRVVVIQAAVRAPDKRMVRRIISINEVVGYDPSSSSFSFIEAFRWNPATDTFEFPGNMNSFILEQIIAVKRGIPYNRRQEIYAEVRRRAAILENLHKKGVKNYYEFFRLLGEAQRKKLV